MGKDFIPIFTRTYARRKKNPSKMIISHLSKRADNKKFAAMIMKTINPDKKYRVVKKSLDNNPTVINENSAPTINIGGIRFGK